jgi:hypothetical protein
MKNYELDNENNYCLTEAEYKRMLGKIDEIKANPKKMSSIEERMYDTEYLIFELLKRPASYANDFDDYIEELIDLHQYVEMLAYIIAKLEFKPVKIPKSYIDKRKKEFLKHLRHLERDMINV